MTQDRALWLTVMNFRPFGSYKIMRISYLRVLIDICRILRIKCYFFTNYSIQPHFENQYVVVKKVKCFFRIAEYVSCL